MLSERQAFMSQSKSEELFILFRQATADAVTAYQETLNKPNSVPARARLSAARESLKAAMAAWQAAERAEKG